MSQRDEIIEQINDFIHGLESDEMYSVTVELINRLDDNIHAEERSEDESWFDGLSQSFTTKEDAMRNAAKSRVRIYFSNTRKSFEKVSLCFLLMLISEAQGGVGRVLLETKENRYLLASPILHLSSI